MGVYVDDGRFYNQKIDISKKRGNLEDVLQGRARKRKRKKWRREAAKTLKEK